MRITAALLCLALAAPAAGEGFFDVYVGGAFTEDHVGRDFENSATGGIRAGVWGEGRIPFLGAAVDISGFSPDGEDELQGADLAVIPISLLLLARLPLLESYEFPQGQIHPYFGIGPSLVISRIDFSQPGPDIEDVEADAGIDVRFGIDALLTEHIGIFGEYRITHFEVEFRDSGLSQSLQFDTHWLQGGLTFRF